MGLRRRHLCAFRGAAQPAHDSLSKPRGFVVVLVILMVMLRSELAYQTGNAIISQSGCFDSTRPRRSLPQNYIPLSNRFKGLRTAVSHVKGFVGCWPGYLAGLGIFGRLICMNYCATIWAQPSDTPCFEQQYIAESCQWVTGPLHHIVYRKGLHQYYSTADLIKNTFVTTKIGHESSTIVSSV